MPGSKLSKFLKLVVLILLCSAQFSKFAIGDNTFIRNQCQIAKEPSTCMKCLESDPRSKNTTDLYVVVTVLLDCMANHASSLQAAMPGLAYDAIDATTKGTYTDCVDWLYSAKSNLLATPLAMKMGEGNYEFANSVLYNALRYHDSCRSSFQRTHTALKNGGGGARTDVNADFDAYGNLYDAATKLMGGGDEA